MALILLVKKGTRGELRREEEIMMSKDVVSGQGADAGGKASQERDRTSEGIEEKSVHPRGEQWKRGVLGTRRGRRSGKLLSHKKDKAHEEESSLDRRNSRALGKSRKLNGKKVRYGRREESDLRGLLWKADAH